MDRVEGKRSPASRVLVRFGADLLELRDCHVLIDERGLMAHIWTDGDSSAPKMTVPLSWTAIEWSSVDGALDPRMTTGLVAFDIEDSSPSHIDDLSPTPSAE